MNFFGYDHRVWLAIGGAILVKIITSEKHSFKRAATIISVSVFAAWVGTDPMVDYMNLDPEKHRVVTAALLALTGESLVRWLSNLDPMKLIQAWRGGK